MELFLIRHAQSANNARPESQRVDDPSITEIGRQQAECLAGFVATLELDRLYTSPFRRTLETTRAIVDRTRLVPEVWVELHEQGGCYSGHEAGKLLGRPGLNALELQQEFPGYRLPASLGEQGWWMSQPYESYDQACERARQLLGRTQRELVNSAERVAFVMHADFKRLFVGGLHNRPIEVPYNASVTHVHIDTSAAELKAYNQVEHLAAELLTL